MGEGRGGLENLRRPITKAEVNARDSYCRSVEPTQKNFLFPPSLASFKGATLKDGAGGLRCTLPVQFRQAFSIVLCNKVSGCFSVTQDGARGGQFWVFLVVFFDAIIG